MKTAYPLLCGVAAGLLCSGIAAFFKPKLRKIIEKILLFAGAALFSLECIVKSVYTTYMTPANIASGAGNAASGYTAELIRSIVRGFPKIVLFFLPLIAVLILERRAGKKQNKMEETAADHAEAEAGVSKEETAKKKGSNRIITNAAVTAAAFLASILLAFAASRSYYSAVYGAQFDYNQATDIFGLVTSTRLSFRYALFGNPYNTFSYLEYAEYNAAKDNASSDEAGHGTAGEFVLPESDDFMHENDASEGSDLSGMIQGNEESAGKTGALPENAPESSEESNPESSEENEAGSSADDTGSSAENAEKAAESDSVETAGEDSGEAEAADPGAEEAEEEAGEGSADEEEQPAEPVYGLHEMDLKLDELTDTGKKNTDLLTEYIRSLTPASENKYTGLFKGKNLILICAESYCDSFINEELTPTLWRLSHNGFHFSEYYQPEWGGSTTTGEASFLLGLAPKDGDQTMMQTIGHNMYFTMGNQLQRLGYSSIAFHGGEDTFYHRDQTHENLGYNQFIANRSGIKDLCGQVYPRDTLAFKGTMDLYLDHQPFSVYYMTISGHAPYKGDHVYVRDYYDKVNSYFGDEYFEKTKYYICYQMELEAAMTVMIEKLEEAGIAEDTVIALVGDHYPYGLGRGEAWGNDRDYINDLIKGNDTIPYEEDRNGLIIWSKCMETEYADLAAEITEPVFSLDILPTLSNLFGLEYDSRLLAGRDVFSDEEAVVFWNNLSYVTKYGKYDSRHNTYTAREDIENPEEEAAYRERIEGIVRNKILLSRNIMESDYYGLLFGPDDVTQAGDVLYPAK